MYKIPIKKAKESQETFAVKQQPQEKPEQKDTMEIENEKLDEEMSKDIGEY